MSEPKDIFRWVWDVENQLEPAEDNHVLSHLWHQMLHARQEYNDEGVIDASREFQRFGQMHDRPWVGVFGRHWELQYRLINRREGMTAVADAVSAFEQANRPENKECPQSICTTQDLCIAYGNVDGPGYAEETLAAATDTLERIDTSWPCWDCLSIESINALEHKQAWGDVLTNIAEVEVELRSAAQRPGLSYATRRLEAMLELGQNDEALAVHDETVLSRYEEHSEDAVPMRRLVYGRILNRVGRTDEALEILKACPNPVDKPPYEDRWRKLVDELLATGDLENSDVLAATRVRIGTAHQRTGSWRRAFATFSEVAIHAAERGAIDTANRARSKCVEAMEQLVKPLDAPDKLAAIDAAIASAPAEISETAQGERRIALLQTKLDDAFDPGVFAEVTQILTMLGWEDAAADLLWERIRLQPSESSTTFTMIGVLQTRGGPHLQRDFAALADLVQAADPAAAHWVRAMGAAEVEQWADCASECSKVISFDEEALNTRRLWAIAERNCGNFAEAVRLSQEILARTATDELTTDAPTEATSTTELDEAAQQEATRARHQRFDDCWWALVHGSLAQDWATVRAVSTELGIEYETDSGPVEERWESCAITMRDDDGAERSHFAQRTGPVTAEILGVSFQGQQRVRDRVVFDPKPLDPLPEDPEEAQNALRRYRGLHTTHAGGYTSFAVESAAEDGEDEAWYSLRNAVHEAGFPIWSYDAGKAIVAATGEEKPVLLVAVAHGPDSSPKELHDLLSALMADWPFPVAWPELAEAAGEDHEAHRERLQNLWS